MIVVKIMPLTVWCLTSVMFDMRCAAENAKGWLLKTAPRTFKLEDIFVEPCGMYAILQLICSVDPTERGGILIRIF